MQRLSHRLQTLQQEDDNIAAIQRDAEADPEGSFLSLLLEWRQQRLRAIELEVQRLMHQAVEMDRTLFGLSDL